MKKILKALLFLTIVLFAFFATIRLDVLLFSGNLGLGYRLLEDAFLIISLCFTIAVLDKIFGNENKSGIEYISLFFAAIVFIATVPLTIESAMSLIKANHYPNIENTKIEKISMPTLINSSRIENYEVVNLEPLARVSNYKFNNVISNADNGKSFYYTTLDREKNSFTLVQIFCTSNATPDIITSTKFSPKEIRSELGRYKWKCENKNSIEINNNLGEIILTYYFKKNIDAKDVQRWIVGTIAFALYALFFILIFMFINKIYFTKVKPIKAE